MNAAGEDRQKSSSSSRNKVDQTWGLPFSRLLYQKCKIDALQGLAHAFTNLGKCKLNVLLDMRIRTYCRTLYRGSPPPNGNCGPQKNHARGGNGGAAAAAPRGGRVVVSEADL